MSGKKILRDHLLGAFITVAYIYALNYVFEDVLGAKSELDSDASKWPNGCVLFCSFLNATSHLAVVMGLLRDTYTISILLGVGFDVLSNLLYAFWWWQRTELPTRSSLPPTSLALLLSGLLVLWTSWILFQHVRALHLAASVERIQSVVTSAWNNIKGDPGPGFQDHFFAFTDTGHHIFHFVWSLRYVESTTNEVEGGLFDMKRRMAGCSVVLLLLILCTQWSVRTKESSKAAHPVGSASNKKTCGRPRTEDGFMSPPVLSVKVMTRSALLPGQGNRAAITNQPLCSCHACRSQTAYSIFPNLCDLWFFSFGEVHSMLQRLELTKGGRR